MFYILLSACSPSIFGAQWTKCILNSGCVGANFSTFSFITSSHWACRERWNCSKWHFHQLFFHHIPFNAAATATERKLLVLAFIHSVCSSSFSTWIFKIFNGNISKFHQFSYGWAFDPYVFWFGAARTRVARSCAWRTQLHLSRRKWNEKKSII